VRAIIITIKISLTQDLSKKINGIMKLTTKKAYYERRKENVHKVEDAIELLEDKIKECIIKEGTSIDLLEKKKIENDIDLFTRLLSGVVIVWCESLIKWLYYEHGAFEEEQIDKLLNTKRSLENKWTTALTTAFYKAFSNSPYSPFIQLPTKDMVINSNVISANDKDKFNKLYDLINDKLVPAIDVRNKIQHGDWLFAFKTSKFNNSGNLTRRAGFDRKLTTKVEQDNVLVLRLKRHQFKLIYDMIKDLAVFTRSGKFRADSSKTPFEFHFGKRYKQILDNQKLIDTSDFQLYRDNLVERVQRGKEWKKKSKWAIWLSRIKKHIKKFY
jgi:hypothetical protein